MDPAARRRQVILVIGVRPRPQCHGVERIRGGLDDGLVRHNGDRIDRDAFLLGMGRLPPLSGARQLPALPRAPQPNRTCLSRLRMSPARTYPALEIPRISSPNSQVKHPRCSEARLLLARHKARSQTRSGLPGQARKCAGMLDRPGALSANGMGDLENQRINALPYTRASKLHGPPGVSRADKGPRRRGSRSYHRPPCR